MSDKHLLTDCEIDEVSGALPRPILPRPLPYWRIFRMWVSR